MKCKQCTQEALDEEIGLCDYCSCEDLFEEWYKDKTKMGEPDQEKWLQDKMVGQTIKNVTVDEYGQIIFLLSSGMEIAFAVSEENPEWVDAYEV